MADYTFGEKTVKRYEVRLETPTYIGEIYRAIDRILTEAKEHHIDTAYDDCVQVRTSDTEIVFWFEVAQD